MTDVSVQGTLGLPSSDRTSSDGFFPERQTDRTICWRQSIYPLGIDGDEPVQSYRRRMSCSQHVLRTKELISYLVLSVFMVWFVAAGPPQGSRAATGWLFGTRVKI